MSQFDFPIFTKGSKLFKSNFVVIDFIANGGMNSKIYKVYMENYTDKIYVAKIVYKPHNVNDDFWKKFLDEEITSLRISNKKNLIQTYETFNYHDDKYDVKVFIMDYVDGISLKQYLSKNYSMVPKMALSIFLKILDGTRTLHNFHHTIIHRDLKPENIILSHDLINVTILDFGISTVVKTSILKKNVNYKYFTDESELYGTAQYITPDALKNKNITVQYDFFALGIILYEMIIGNRPFNDEKILNDKKYQKKIINLPLKYDMANISAHSSIPIALENLIFKCIASKDSDIKYRYNNIDEIINDTKRCIAILNGKENDDTTLLKPIYKRVYQNSHLFNLEIIKNKLPFYKQWWFFIFIFTLTIIFITIFVLLFFIHH